MYVYIYIYIHTLTYTYLYIYIYIHYIQWMCLLRRYYGKTCYTVIHVKVVMWYACLMFDTLPPSLGLDEIQTNANWGWDLWSTKNFRNWQAGLIWKYRIPSQLVHNIKLIIISIHPIKSHLESNVEGHFPIFKGTQFAPTKTEPRNSLLRPLLMHAFHSELTGQRAERGKPPGLPQILILTYSNHKFMCLDFRRNGGRKERRRNLIRKQPLPGHQIETLLEFHMSSQYSLT